MQRIQRTSAFFRTVFQVLFVALPALQIIGWYYAPEPVSFLIHIFNMTVIPSTYEHHILHTLTTSERVLGFVVTMIPLAIELFILYSLIKLFKLYEQNEIFSINNVRYIRNTGYGLLATQIVNPFYQFIMGLVLTLGNPPGHRLAAIMLDQTNLGILLTSLLVILISWIMAEGCKLREEQHLTI